MKDIHVVSLLPIELHDLPQSLLVVSAGRGMGIQWHLLLQLLRRIFDEQSAALHLGSLILLFSLPLEVLGRFPRVLLQHAVHVSRALEL